MTDNYRFTRVIGEIETLSVEGIRDCFAGGLDPNDQFMEEPLVNQLIQGYARGPQFKACFKVFVDYGLRFGDTILKAVFLDDADLLDTLLTQGNQAIHNKYTFKSAFTPLYKASLLHICVEYDHLACAKVLIKHGIDSNVKAGTDANGFGGQTPVFHTVNQHANCGVDMLDYLISESADLTLNIRGLIWGMGYDWETFIPSVNPISYAMMGLLRQFQRTEELTYSRVSILLKAAYGVDYKPSNVPNKYLH